MITALSIIGGIVASIIIILLVGALMFTINYIRLYQCHRCPHCGHFMDFKGFKEDSNGGLECCRYDEE